MSQNRISRNLSDIWNLKRRGKRDSDRHKELIKKAIQKHGKDLITEYDIITSDGNRKVRVPIRFLEQYKFKYGKLHERKGSGQGVDGKVGTRYKLSGPSDDPGNGAGDKAGELYYETEVTIDEIVDLLLQELDLPWMEPTKNSIIEVENEELSSIDKHGNISNIDLRKTIRENIKRNAASGSAEIKDFKNEDLRYKSWENELEMHSNAAVYLMMDRSGSMDKDKTKIAKTFYFWMVQFLKRRYKHIEFVFIAHDVEAFICKEEDFFKILSNGGTKCSSAFELAYDHILVNHPVEEFNNYICELSDGDNLQDDNEKCLEYIEKLLPLSRAIGYGEIDSSSEHKWVSGEITLANYLKEKINRTRFVSLQFKSQDDVFEALKSFFNIDGKNKKKNE